MAAADENENLNIIFFVYRIQTIYSFLNVANEILAIKNKTT